MGSEDFLLCLSRQALEASCAKASVQPRQKVRETRAALVEHFVTNHFVHSSGRFAPPRDELYEWLKSGAGTDAVEAVSRCAAVSEPDGAGDQPAEQNPKNDDIDKMK
jgi:ParB family chromosome partitioning protein